MRPVLCIGSHFSLALKMGKYQHEEYIVTVVGSETHKYREQLKDLGLYFQDELLFDTFSVIEGKGWIQNEVCIEQASVVARFCAGKKLTCNVVHIPDKITDKPKMWSGKKIIESVPEQFPVMQRKGGDILKDGWVNIDASLFWRLRRRDEEYKKRGWHVLLTSCVELLLEKGIKRVRISDTRDKKVFHTFTYYFDKYGYKTDSGVIGLDVARFNTGCYDCPLYKNSRGPQVPATGPDSGLVFIGEAPWTEEVKEFKPFVGPAGKMFTKILDDVGIDRQKTYITNTIQCLPDERKHGSKKPQPEEIEACSQRLLDELIIVNPKVIVTLGKTATDNLLPEFSKMNMTSLQQGSNVFEMTRGPLMGTIVIPMFHPSYLLRNPSWEPGSPKYINRIRARFLRKVCDQLKIF